MDEIKAQGILFFLAGYDTTANALSWLMYILACNPDIQEKVYDEIQEKIGNSVSKKNLWNDDTIHSSFLWIIQSWQR